MSYLATKLNTSVETVPFEDTDGFPNYILWAYCLEIITLYEVDFLRLTPKEKRSLTDLKKDYTKISILSKLPCVFQVRNLTKYAEKNLIAEHIPFYVPDGLIYIPFAGLFLQDMKQKSAKKYSRISPVTQHILLSALYGGWQRKNLSEIASNLGMSKMSVSRAFDEIAFYLPALIQEEGKKRYLAIGPSRAAYYQEVKQILRDPVAKVLRLGSVPDIKLRLGGMSAVSQYSMLNDNKITTFAVSAKSAKGIDFDKYGIVADEEEPFCIVQVVRYIIDYDDGTAIDPISAILSLNNEELADPRVAAATEEIVGEIVNERH